MRSVIFSEEQHENKVSEDPHEQDSWLTKILSRIFPGIMTRYSNLVN